MEIPNFLSDIFDNKIEDRHIYIYIERERLHYSSCIAHHSSIFNTLNGMIKMPKSMNGWLKRLKRMCFANTNSY